MGTTLTGTTPQDTYDSLIKVTDNGPLSGTAKYLSDGLGNDSKLALSTGNIGIGTTSPADSLDILNTSTTAAIRLAGTAAGSKVYRLTSAIIGASNTGFAIRNETDTRNELSIDGSGFVGIGTSSAESKLHVAGSASGSDVTLYIDNAASSALNNSSRIKFSSDTGSSVSGGGAELNCINVNAGNGAVDLFIKSWTGAAYTEKARFLATGGLTFNGDTAAANALDDYEEGTWTMGVSFGGASVGVTYSSNTGTYTKIGRQVTVNGFMQLTSKGSSTGIAAITGLPFTIASGNGFYSAPSLRYSSVTYTGQFTGFGDPTSTTIRLDQNTEAGANTNFNETNFDNTSTVLLSFTYFV